MNFSRPNIMGILNVTPDSFSDGGKYIYVDAALRRIEEMIKDGADIIDIGGESTRPDSFHVSFDEEMRRVMPLIDAIDIHNLSRDAIFSIDTHKADIAEYALRHDFGMVNDVTALRGDLKMIDMVMRYKPFVVMMYAKDNTPRTTRKKVQYADIVLTIKEFLSGRIAVLEDAGFPRDRIIIDPGMGMFVSSDASYSFEIVERLSELRGLYSPMLVGCSRKLFSGTMEDRDYASALLSLKAIQRGAAIIRTHNVKIMRQFLNI